MSNRTLKYLTLVIFTLALLVWAGVGWVYLNQRGLFKSPLPEITISPSTQSLSYSPIKPINENFQEFILEGLLVKVEEDAILIQAGKMQKFYRFTEPKIILLSKNYNLGSQVRVVLQRKENDQLEAIEISLAK